MVRVAMLSFAHVHAEGYAKEVESIPEARIVAVWDEDPERGKEAARRHNVPFFEKLEDVLEMEEVDGVVLNAPTSMHGEIIKKAARAGKHVFTEKALTITTKEADEVVEAVEGYGIKFMISLPSRCRPEILFAKRVVEEGIIGRVATARARIAHSAALDGWFGPGNWFRDERRAGGGAYFDLGCHRVDVIRWLLGEPYCVIARVNNFSGSYEIDDNSAAVIEFRNKALAMIDVTWVHRSGPNPLELYGTDGSLIIGYERMMLTSSMLSKEEAEEMTRNLPSPLPSPLRQWIDAIDKGSPMTITVRDGRNLTELLEATYISAREGRAVYLPI
jgi:1,5-anhydro-D-fructose reductase (1,5-anhydro-D-mannitol-forming)